MNIGLNHTAVLLNEAVDAMLGDAPTAAPRTFVDATFGRGGHSQLLLSRLGPSDRLIAYDKDPQAVASAAQIRDPRFSIRHQGFDRMVELEAASVTGILMDLGVSSPQIDDPERGFSFRFHGPLDMRMDTTRGQSVAQWLADAPASQIAEVIRDYGEERFAGAIAKAIVARRQERGPIASTTDLAELVADTVKTREPGQNPATRTFQAFRIFINAELEALQTALDVSLDILQPQGLLVVISFHSLEDRIVKQFIASQARELVDRRVPFAPARPLRLTALGRIKPSASEVAANPRARSAIMRIAQRTRTP